MERSDFDLMEAVRRDDADAFAALIRRHQQPLANFFRRIGASKDIEDLVQETFLRLYRYRGRYRPSARFSTFLYTLARNTWFDALRRLRTRERVVESLNAEESAGAEPAAAVPDTAGQMDLEQALAGLDERLRMVVVLGVLQGLPYAEIAEVLDIPVGTVKSRMFAALRELRRTFHEDT